MKLLLALIFLLMHVSAQTKPDWCAATPAELEAFLPARAPVERERIETEMRTASGIIDRRGRRVAAVVLITAGYAADGKYSHYLLTEQPLTLGDTLHLPPEPTSSAGSALTPASSSTSTTTPPAPSVVPRSPTPSPSQKASNPSASGPPTPNPSSR